SVYTQGLNAAGLVAQSIGGGGGVAAAASSVGSVFAGTLQLGATAGGSAANGQRVSLVLGASGAGGAARPVISTEGALAPAVLAQSIGGGGGHGALRASDLVFGGNTGSGGGAVTVRSDASLATGGATSAGLVAQSIGGGGGL